MPLNQQNDVVLRNPQRSKQSFYSDNIVVGQSVDHFVTYDDLDHGDLHIGGQDCTHYCMPGVPDVVAAKLLALSHTAVVRIEVLVWSVGMFHSVSCSKIWHECL
mgnify:CR=1 FL=1